MTRMTKQATEDKRIFMLRLIFSLILGILFLCAPYTSNYGSKLEQNLFKCEKLHFSMLLPYNWNICNQPGSGNISMDRDFYKWHNAKAEMLFAGGTPDGMLWVSAYAQENMLPLEAYYKIVIESLKANADTILSKENIAVYNVPMIKIEYLLTENKSKAKFKFLEYQFSSGNSKVRIVFNCFESIFPDLKNQFEEVISSLKFGV